MEKKGRKGMGSAGRGWAGAVAQMAVSSVGVREGLTLTLSPVL